MGWEEPFCLPWFIGKNLKGDFILVDRVSLDNLWSFFSLPSAGVTGPWPKDCLLKSNIYLFYLFFESFPQHVLAVSIPTISRSDLLPYPSNSVSFKNTIKTNECCPKYACMCGLSLEYFWPTRDHSVRENKPIFSHQLTPTNYSMVGGGTVCPTPFFLLGFGLAWPC